MYVLNLAHLITKRRKKIKTIKKNKMKKKTLKIPINLHFILFYLKVFLFLFNIANNLENTNYQNKSR